MKNILFPAGFRLIGWFLFIPAVSGGIIRYFDVIEPTGLSATIINDFILIGMVLGALFIVCSKQRNEDEMTKAIRLSSILNAVYANAVIFILGTLVTNGPDYIMFLIFNLGLLPLIFVFVYTAEMNTHYKHSEDEE